MVVGNGRRYRRVNSFRARFRVSRKIRLYAMELTTKTSRSTIWQGFKQCARVSVRPASMQFRRPSMGFSKVQYFRTTVRSSRAITQQRTHQQYRPKVFYSKQYLFERRPVSCPLHPAIIGRTAAAPRGYQRYVHSRQP